MNFSEIDASVVAAWWGAVIASLAFIWNIVTYFKQGPKLRTTASPNMKFFPEDERTAGKTYIRLSATNVGTSPTTVTNYCGYYASSRLRLLLRKANYFVVNVTRDMSSPIPYLLNPGDVWSGMLDQTGFSEDGPPPKFLYVGVAHSHSNKIKYVRVKVHA